MAAAAAVAAPAAVEAVHSTRKRPVVATAAPSLSLRTAKRHKAVHFSAEPVVLGFAATDYDRRSVEVDLSTTPYALLHKDAYLLEHPTDESGSAQSAKRQPCRSSSSDDEATAESEGGATSSGSSNCSSDDETGDSDDPRPSQGSPQSRPNFTGIWKRCRVDGFVDLLVFSGVPRRTAVAAAHKHPVHIIEHDDDYFRLIVKNGLARADSHYIIGDEPRRERSGKTDYEVLLDWRHTHGREHSLVLTSTSVDDSRSAGGEVEMAAVRTLEGGGGVLVLTQVVRRRATGEERRACHIFKRVTAVNKPSFCG